MDVHLMMKIGPWGGTGGTPWDILENSWRLEGITVRSSNRYGGRIYGFCFLYVNYKGQSFAGGTWGHTTEGSRETQITMGPGELVNNVCGMVDETGVRCLLFKTNTGLQRIYGYPSGMAFTCSGDVVGFFGRSTDDSLVALGVYVAPSYATRFPVCSEKVPSTLIFTQPAQGGAQLKQDKQPDVHSMMKIGPWGGTSGTPRDIHRGNSNRPHRLESITIHSTNSYGGRINGFSFVYVDYKGQYIDVGTWGSSTKGYDETIIMGPGEHINYISGKANETGVRSLTFVTNTGVKYGPYGDTSGTPTSFSVPLQQSGGAVLGFFGRADESLVAFGIYVAVRNALN